jgi:Zn finger protein HypA/HybF involved in hydrogenase expression
LAREAEFDDIAHALVLDGNAVAGLLEEIFGIEMTITPIECAHCGNKGAVGTLAVYAQGPGTVLRCPACKEVMVRIVQTGNAVYLDMRGAAYLRLERRSG